MKKIYKIAILCIVVGVIFYLLYFKLWGYGKYYQQGYDQGYSAGIQLRPKKTPDFLDAHSWWVEELGKQAISLVKKKGGWKKIKTEIENLKGYVEYHGWDAQVISYDPAICIVSFQYATLEDMQKGLRTGCWWRVMPFENFVERLDRSKYFREKRIADSLRQEKKKREGKGLFDKYIKKK